jgi:hypothetical protein
LQRIYRECFCASDGCDERDFFDHIFDPAIVEFSKRARENNRDGSAIARSSLRDMWGHAEARRTRRRKCSPECVKFASLLSVEALRETSSPRSPRLSAYAKATADKIIFLTRRSLSEGGRVPHLLPIANHGIPEPGEKRRRIHFILHRAGIPDTR